MTKEERIKLYAALSAPFPEEAIERTEAAITGRGYDTTGIKYQYLADRLNEVLGVGGFRTERTISVKHITTAKGRPAYEAIAEVRLELGEWSDGEFIVFAQAWGDGGHTATAEADARKGSFTNAFKKAAAFMGPGREAYRGTIDDDHVPAADLGLPTDRRSDVAPVEVEHHDRKANADRTSRFEGETPSSPRVTNAQLGKLRHLVTESGSDWSTFRNSVRERHRINVEYADRRLASELIQELLPPTQNTANGNGHNNGRSNGWRR
jgi:hypothetical protein